MPLTPLYRQGPPLTPLALRLNAVNAVIPEKKACLLKIYFLRHEESKIKNSWLIKKNFDKRSRSFQSNISSLLWWKRWGLESGPESARTEIQVQLTDGDIPRSTHRLPWRSHGAHPWQATVRWWSIADNEKNSEKFVQVENWHVHMGEDESKMKQWNRRKSSVICGIQKPKGDSVEEN